MIECTLDVLKNMDQYSDDTEFFAYKVSRKDGSSFLYADKQTFASRKASIWFNNDLKTIEEEEKLFIPLTHAVGTKFEVLMADTNVKHDCGSGVNVGTLSFLQDFVTIYKHPNYKDINGPYCLSYSDEEYGIALWKVKFTKKDIACIPTGNHWAGIKDGISQKFRLFRCEVIEELPLSLLEIIKEEVQANEPVAAA